MNKKIIQAKERLYILSHDVKNYEFIIGCTLGFFALAISVISMRNDPTSLFLLIATMLFLILSFIFALYATVEFSRGHQDTIENVYLQDFIYILLDKVIPGKEARQREFLAFCAMNPPTIKNKNLFKNFTTDERFNIKQKDLAQWINDYVGKEKTLYNIIVSRCSDNSGFKKELLYWSQLFPSKNLSLDDMRLLLLTNQITSVHELRNFPIISKDELESYFINYEAKDIVKIFTTAYKLSDYLDIISQAKKYQLTFPIRKTFTDLMFFIKETISNIEGEEFYFKRNKEWISKVEIESELGRVVMIDNAMMLTEWAENMRNCIRSKKQAIRKEKSYLFGVIKNNHPYIVFELNHKGHLIEAKKLANQELSREEIKALKNFLNSIE